MTSAMFLPEKCHGSWFQPWKNTPLTVSLGVGCKSQISNKSQEVWQKNLAKMEGGLQFKQSSLLACNQQITRGADAVSSSHHQLKIKIAVLWNWTMICHVKLLDSFLQIVVLRGTIEQEVSWDFQECFCVSIGILNYNLTCGHPKV